MRNKQDVVDEARTWVGVKWRHQGRTRSGVDCCGLAIMVGNDLGLIDFDTTRYSRRTSGDQFINHFYAAGMVHVPVRDVAPGDVLITTDHLFPCHCGIVSEKNRELHFIHAHAMRRKVVEHPFSQWAHMAVAGFSYPGVY